MDLHDWRTQPNTSNFCIEGPLILASVVRDIGGRAAHVEADDLVQPCKPRCAHCADDAACGAGQNRVLAIERLRVRQPSGRLHELQRHTRKLARDLLHIAAQDR